GGRGTCSTWGTEWSPRPIRRRCARWSISSTRTRNGGRPPMPEETPIGLLVMAYGTASGPDDVERYYTDIRGGRAPTPEHLEELEGRYAAIGNRFPLLDITTRQAAGVAAELNESAGFEAYHPYLGMKHSPPFIADGVERMRDDGIVRAVGVVMAPHWSGMSVEDYVRRVEAAVSANGGPAMSYVRQWYERPGFRGLLGG